MFDSVPFVQLLELQRIGTTVMLQIAERAEAADLRDELRDLKARYTEEKAAREAAEHDASAPPRKAAPAPKVPRALVREEAARELIAETGHRDGRDWVQARDSAILLLLYGCGLRISEALGLTGRDHPLGETLRITGKGGKMRVVPVLPAVREACAEYVRLCPFDLEPAAALFRGTRGGALGPRSVQALMSELEHHGRRPRQAQLGEPRFL